MRLGRHAVKLRDMDFKTGFLNANDLVDQARKTEFGNYFFCSASTVVNASRNRDLANILNAGVAIPDSTPLAWILTGNRNCVIRGTSFTRFLLENAATMETIFLIGSTKEVLSKFSANASKMNPNVNIVGTFSPSFSDPIETKVDLSAQLISIKKPKYILVALSSPQQDFFIHELSKRVPGRYFAVGAAFDFIAESKPEAPRWLQRSGLEWVFRLITEPRRLWKRYLFDNATFLKLSLVYWISKTKRTDQI